MPGSFFLCTGSRAFVPLYWIVTSIMLVYDLARGFTASDVSPALAIWSFLFIPYLRPSGEMGPLYGVGWTLNYEIFFYGIFAIGLVARRELAIASTVSLLLGLAVINVTIHELPDQVVYWSDPLILEFIFGMVLALIYRAGYRLHPAVSALLLLAAFAILAGFRLARNR